MKAPDKIYIESNDDDSMWDMNERYHESDIEYIRKDALLEWAKSYQAEEREGSFLWSCYQIFIDKLNSM